MRTHLNIQHEELEAASESIMTEICQMVFGDFSDLQRSVTYFTHAGLRKELSNAAIVWKDGKKKFPHINKSTGLVALYNNLLAWKLARSPQILQPIAHAYQCRPDALQLHHAPPAPIVKPWGSNKSMPYIYAFSRSDGKIDSDQRFTAVVCLSEHVNDSDLNQDQARFQLLENFELYFDLLAAYFEFDKHVKTGDLFYLKPDWFSIETANEIISEYTDLFNYYERNIPCSSSRLIRYEVAQVYEKLGLVVPRHPKLLSWTDLECKLGDMYVFSNRQAVRTLANNTTTPRVYLQLVLKPSCASCKHLNDLTSESNNQKFGNWSKPGLRQFIRENSTEYMWRTQK